MKTVKELQGIVMRRLACCWGENIALFFITAGGVTAVVLVWQITVDFLKAMGYMEDYIKGAALLVTAADILLIWFISKPFMYGIRWYRIQQIRGNSVHARSVFSCYGSLKRAGQVFKLSILLFIRRLVFLIPLTAVLAAGLYAAERFGSASYSASCCAAALLFLLIICIIAAACLFNFKYALVPYLFALNPDKSPKELICNSVKISDGKLGYFVTSFFYAARWLALCIFIFPAVFVLPYTYMFYTAVINEIIEAYGEETAVCGREEADER